MATFFKLNKFWHNIFLNLGVLSLDKLNFNNNQNRLNMPKILRQLNDQSAYYKAQLGM